jgi:hypothetical protein
MLPPSAQDVTWMTERWPTTQNPITKWRENQKFCQKRAGATLRHLSPEPAKSVLTTRVMAASPTPAGQSVEHVKTEVIYPGNLAFL